MWSVQDRAPDDPIVSRLPEIDPTNKKDSRQRAESKQTLASNSLSPVSAHKQAVRKDGWTVVKYTLGVVQPLPWMVRPPHTGAGAQETPWIVEIPEVNAAIGHSTIGRITVERQSPERLSITFSVLRTAWSM